MTRKNLPGLRILGPFVLAILSAPALTVAQKSVLDYLPNLGQSDGWSTLGEPQTAEGDDLFFLINGGAEIYHEYGFSRAVIQSYDRGEVSINLEIYEMENVESAYAVYSFKTARGGESVDIGAESSFEEYYLNFWKGKVVVTLIGFDTSSATRSGILELARAVDSNILGDSPTPALVGILPDTVLNSTGKHTTYLVGNLGLLNRYRFGNEDVFGFKRGVVGNYGDFSVFVFVYDSPSGARAGLNAARSYISQSDRYSGFSEEGDAFSAFDLDNRRIYCNLKLGYLIVFVGENLDDAATVVEIVEQRISENDSLEQEVR